MGQANEAGMDLLFSSKGLAASKCLTEAGHKRLIFVRYINHHNIPVAKQFFPNMQLEQLETGHWGKL